MDTALFYCLLEYVARILIEEAEKPKRYLVAIANVTLVDSVKRLGFALQLGAVLSNLEFHLLVNKK